jgi:hypothetical protein
MPKATQCSLDGRTVDIDEALQLRDDAVRRRKPYPEFCCIECGEYVRPHKEGTTGQGAHFEHRRKSPGCRYGSDH